ncbi:MAG: tetratricopeptide repeat protein [Holophagaceae bacterium]
MTSPEAPFHRAHALHRSGDLAGAARGYREVLEAAPGHGGALHFLGVIAWQQGRLGEAEALMREALEAGGEAAPVLCNLGGVLRGKGDLPGALAAYREALRLEPADEAARRGLVDTLARHGLVLAEAQAFPAAEAAFRELLAREPRHAAALNNLGKLRQREGDLEGAVACFDRALAADPGYGLGRFNRGIATLGRNRLAEGWADLAASVATWLPTLDRRRDLPWLRRPRWDGGELAGKGILVWGDQGIGDELLFAGLVPDLRSRGARVHVDCEPRLAPLLERAFPGLKAWPRGGPFPPAADVDVHAPGLWLARLLRPSFEAFPRHGGYLKADPGQVAELRARCAVPGVRRITGLAWRSGPADRPSPRGLGLLELAAALPREGVRYVDLQYGDTAAERAEARARFPDLDLFHDASVDQLKDMDRFMAQVRACDDVVTIGNTTAHAAGALGVPGTVLLPVQSLTWYWFLDRPDSPWYPSLALLRQREPGDWTAPLAALREARRA